MSEKKRKFEQELDRLISNGELLEMAILREFSGKDTDDELAGSVGKEKAKAILGELPDFKLDYQAWYSEALALVRQILPDRLQDFISYYEYPSVRKEITHQNYMIRDYLQGLQITKESVFEEKEVIVDGSSAIPEFRQQLNIIKATKATLTSALIDLTLLIQADLFDSETESARALAKAGYFRAAGAICGVVIEKHLKQVCVNHSIRIRKKRPTIFDLIQILRDKDTISVPQWRFVQHLSDIRNICDHDKGKEPTKEEIADLISGTEKILKTVF